MARCLEVNGALKARLLKELKARGRGRPKKKRRASPVKSRSPPRRTISSFSAPTLSTGRNPKPPVRR